MPMRIIISCLACIAEGRGPSRMIAKPLEDSNLYAMTCERGHESTICCQQMKFEILFDLGAYAITDDYPREAVASFASALERFYEFYVQVQCTRREIEEIAFNGAWKAVTNQSERQLGAFIIMYLAEEKTAPQLLSNKSIEFRNAVIHKGKIPSVDEAIKFGEQVANLIVAVLSRLRAADDGSIGKLVGQHLRNLRQKVESQHVATMSFMTMISLTRATSEPQPSLKDYLVTLREMRTVFTKAGLT